MNWGRVKERYKNDPEYLEMLRQERNKKAREKYARDKEKKNEHISGNTDSHTTSDISTLHSMAETGL